MAISVFCTLRARLHECSFSCRLLFSANLPYLVVAVVRSCDWRVLPPLVSSFYMHQHCLVLFDLILLTSCAIPLPSPLMPHTVTKNTSGSESCLTGTGLESFINSCRDPLSTLTHLVVDGVSKLSAEHVMTIGTACPNLSVLLLETDFKVWVCASFHVLSIIHSVSYILTVCCWYHEPGHFRVRSLTPLVSTDLSASVCGQH